MKHGQEISQPRQLNSLRAKGFLSASLESFRTLGTQRQVNFVSMRSKKKVFRAVIGFYSAVSALP